MANFDETNPPHLDSHAAGRREVARMEAAGIEFHETPLRDITLPGLRCNRSTDLTILLSTQAIMALRNSVARLEVVLSNSEVHPFIAMCEFRGSMRLAFRQSDCAFVIDPCRTLNVKSLQYAPSFVHIGKHSSSNECSMTVSDASVLIGRDCMFSHGITLQPSDQHDIFDVETKQTINTSRSIVLQDHVWLGKGAYVGAGARIDSGSIIGAQSVVTGKVGANVVVAGNPARVVREGATWEREFNKVKTGSGTE